MKPMTHRNLDWIEQAPVKVTEERRIGVPVENVWRAIADHEGWADWFGAITRIERIGSGEGVGSGRRVFLKGGVKAEEEFLAWEPDARFAFVLTSSSMPGMRSMVEDVQLLPEGAGATIVRYTQAVEPAAPKIMGPVLRAALPKGIQSGLAGLEKHLLP
ncbi:MAG: SRPBCC family protein [Acidimicrobiales bacterium]|nr:SRPBCC family protein [Acidimicrobiales bacterium]